MWWNDLSNFQQVIFIIATSATIILFIFLILLLLGLGDESFDGNADFDDFDDFDIYNDEPIGAFSGMRILTLRGVLSFLSVGGWVAFILEPSVGILWALLVGVAAGTVTAVLLAMAFHWSLRLESSGNIDYKNAIGKTATVYLRVPKSKNGFGKVNLLLQDRLVEVNAVTSSKEDLLVNSLVVVTGLENENTLIVEIRKEEDNG